MSTYQHKRGIWRSYWFYSLHTGHQSCPYETREAMLAALACATGEQP